jgi:ubiquitin conjugation factor E4 B
MTFQFNQ